MIQIRFYSFLLLILTVFLSGCGGVPRAIEGLRQETVFRPPTPVSALPTATIPSAETRDPANTAASEAECKNVLAFINDLTIPDGTEVVAESTLDKRWEVQNSGSCNWGENYRVRLIAGPELGAQKEQALYPARSGSRAIIRIQFKAPKEPGTYRSAWQAFDAQGEPFGDPFFIEIVVKE